MNNIKLKYSEALEIREIYGSLEINSNMNTDINKRSSSRIEISINLKTEPILVDDKKNKRLSARKLILNNI
tara:strand:- start:6573 stop:6785 length:213 start_codon:yes stop_codon:yes gene_type:complete